MHRHTHSPRFAVIWIASLALSFLVAFLFAQRRQTASQVLGPGAPSPSPRLPAAGPSPPEDRPLLSQGCWVTALDRMGTGFLESTRVRSPVVEHNADGDSLDGLRSSSATR